MAVRFSGTGGLQVLFEETYTFNIVEYDERLPEIRGEVKVTVEPRAAVALWPWQSNAVAPPHDCAQVISARVRDGLEHSIAGSGSHQIYRHSDGGRVKVTFHASGDTAVAQLSYDASRHDDASRHKTTPFARKTVKSMIETQGKWTGKDLRRMKLAR